MLIGAGGSVSFTVEDSDVKSVLAVGMEVRQTAHCLVFTEDEHKWLLRIGVLLEETSQPPVAHLRN